MTFLAQIDFRSELKIEYEPTLAHKFGPHPMGRVLERRDPKNAQTNSKSRTKSDRKRNDRIYIERENTIGEWQQEHRDKAEAPWRTYK